MLPSWRHGRKGIFFILFPFCFLSPDISRTGSTQKQRRSLIDGVKVGEAHDVVQVRRDGLQVDSPGIVAILLHQVSQQELTHRALLRDGGTLVSRHEPTKTLHLFTSPGSLFWFYGLQLYSSISQHHFSNWRKLRTNCVLPAQNQTADRH